MGINISNETLRLIVGKSLLDWDMAAIIRDADEKWKTSAYFNAMQMFS
jgi:hypothetical protein